MEFSSTRRLAHSTSYRNMLVMIILVVTLCELTMASYWSRRAELITKEKYVAVGGDLTLNSSENNVNKKIVALKKEEFALGRENPSKFLASRNFLAVKSDIEQSKVFNCIRKIPKGASLHSHLFASASFDYVFDNLTHRENLYACEVDGRFKLKFLADAGEGCELLADKRQRESFNTWLRQQLILESTDENVNEMWNHFRKILTATYDLFTYRPVFKEYVYEVLKEHYFDNVLYVELRGPFVSLYDLDGTTHDAFDFIQVLWETAERFKSDFPDFIGMKYIYAQYRRVENETMCGNFAVLKQLMVKYPNFIAGVDFVGFEEDGALKNYVDDLRKVQDLNFYFHAGETNWYGNEVDCNLYDAILLGSKRIGHAFALPKHPELMKMVKKHDIAIEISPISNQVLKLVGDLRNHPGNHFIADGYSVVICNDDPGNWGAKGLSYDWYMAFMGMSSEEAGLELLKKFALNSIKYSAMTDDEKDRAYTRWNIQWNEFISGEVLG